MMNIITGQMISHEIYNNLINFEVVGKSLYKEFVHERLKAESKVDIFAPIRKS